MSREDVSGTERINKLRALKNTTSSRREFLNRAAALGLIPVLAGGSGLAPFGSALASQENSPVQGGTFVTLGHQEVASLSPEAAGPTVQWVAIAQIHNALYELDHNYELVPVLAESYEPSEDGLTYTFKLRNDVKFHNGDSFTSADVKYTFDWIMDEANASTRAAEFELVESVETPDDTTVVVTLTEPDVTFMVNVGQTYIYPSAYHAEVGEEEYSANPVGTGPFKLLEWNAQQRTVLERFDEHFRGPANFDQFQLDIVPEAAGRLAALESGQADNSIWALNAEDNQLLVDSGNFTVFETMNVATNHFPVNNTHPVLSDKAVRKAMMHAIDRQSLADDIFLGQAVIATSNLSPAIEKFYNPDVVTYDYNPDTARQLLEEAGWVEGEDGIREKDGEKLSFTCVTITGDTQRRPEAEIAQQQLREVGMDMQLQEATVDIILEAMVAGEMEMSLFNWTYGGNNGDPDARDTLMTGGANNFSNFSNERVDELLTKGVTELDEEKRIEMYREIQAIIAEEVPFIYLLVFTGFSYYSNSIKGLPESVLSSDNLYPFLFQLWKEEA
ncbi:MAG TPA: ABC transporter substrate-binding protein [Thermomicrobiales bacterium]|nr:ABC transporter substrate-binding protein [Thermomicrobiales bacterium]